MKSFMANPSNIERKWFVVDAADKTLGRLAAEVAKVPLHPDQENQFFSYCNISYKNMQGMQGVKATKSLSLPAQTSILKSTSQTGEPQ